MRWRSDPVTQAQVKFLAKLGATEMPKTKGDASRLIDNILRTKHGKTHKNPALKLYRPNDANARVDEAAERVKKELRENQTPLLQRTPTDGAAVPHLKVVGMDWTDASNEDGSGQDHPPRTQSDRGTGEAEAKTEDDTHRGQDAAEARG